jgi:hypothetical protein
MTPVGFSAKSLKTRRDELGMTSRPDIAQNTISSRSEPHRVRGVAVLDRRDRLCLLETLDCASTSGLLVEKALYASVDALDEKVSASGALGATAAERGDGEPIGLYLGQLATLGQLAVYGFVTSVNRRVLVCTERDRHSEEKIDDVTVRDMLRELSQLYVEETAANPFRDQEGGAPVVFLDKDRLRAIVGTL